MDPLLLDDEGASAPSLSKLRKLGEDMMQLEREVSDLEELLKIKRSAAYKLKTERLPEEMAKAGLSFFELKSGGSIEIKDFVQGSLPKEDEQRRIEAIAYLSEIDGEGIIKNSITIEFSKSQHNEALSLNAELQQKGFETVLKHDVHTGTLQAFIREKLRNGENVDANKLGCQIGQVAKVKLEKGEKK